MSSAAAAAADKGRQTAFMAQQQPGMSMADKLRLWKAEKAKQSGGAAPTASAKAAPTKAAPSATAAAPTVSHKRAFSSVTTTDKAKASASSSSVVVAKKARTATATVEVKAASVRSASAKPTAARAATVKAAPKPTISSAPVAPAPAPIRATTPAPEAMEEEEEDVNEDLGISFSSTEGTPPPAVPAVTTRQPHTTPISSNLRAQFAAADDTEMEVAPVAPVVPQLVTSTPRADKLRAAMKMTPPSSAVRASTTSTLCATPIAASLARDLRVDVAPFSAAKSAAAAAQTNTPHAERLREALMRRTSPVGGSRAPAGSCTPVASALREQLRTARTPLLDPEEAVTLRLSPSKIVASAQRSVPRSSRATAAAAAAAAAEEDDLVNSSSRGVYLDSSVSSAGDEEAPVARNLMDEMDDPLNASATSQTSEIVSDAAPNALDTTLSTHASNISHEHEPVDVSSASSGLFLEDEYIPGLSTPAPSTLSHLHRFGATPSASSPLDSSSGSVLSGIQLFSVEEATSPPLRLATANFHSPVLETVTAPAATAAAPTPSRHARLLTPSKAQTRASSLSPSSSESAGGSNVVLASVRAHPRDAARMGSATFLSPVRRSSRHQRAAAAAASEGEVSSESNSITTTTSTNMADVDAPTLQRMLRANNYAYHPNPALGRQLTPIPQQRRSRVSSEEKRAAVAAAASQLEVIEETPSTVVVLQAVRSRRRSTASPAAAAAASVDPRSSEYLLSPVRRSARHTAPQSMAELTKILAHTQYAYQPNPLLEELQTGANKTAAAPVPAAAASSSSASKTPVSRGHAKKLSAIEEEFESEETTDVSPEEADEYEENEAVMYSPAVTRVAPRATGATRIGTPLPGRKHSAMTTSLSSEVMNWEKSYSSGSTGASSGGFDSSATTTYVKEPFVPLTNVRDADGFLVPLPIAPKSRPTASSSSSSSSSASTTSRGAKRKAHHGSTPSLDDLEAKLSLVAVSMLEHGFGVGPSSIPASTGATRTHTPRPPMKKQKRSSDFDDYLMEQERQQSTRRSTRVATPIR